MADQAKGKGITPKRASNPADPGQSSRHLLPIRTLLEDKEDSKDYSKVIEVLKHISAIKNISSTLASLTNSRNATAATARKTSYSPRFDPFSGTMDLDSPPRPPRKEPYLGPAVNLATSNLDPPIDTESKEGFKDTFTSSIVKELSKKAYTIPDDKNPDISNTYSDSNQAVLLIILRDSLSSSPRAAISWIYIPSKALKLLVRQYSRPIESKKEDVYNEFHTLTFSTYRKGLLAFNAEFNSYLAKLTIAKIDMDPSLILNQNPAIEVYRAAHVANSSNSTPNSNSYPSKKGKNKKKAIEEEEEFDSNDCLFIGPNIGYITDLKKRLNKVYAIEDLGPAAYFLGLSRDFYSKEGPRPLTTTSTTIVDSRNSKGSSRTSIINSSLVPIGFSDSDFTGDKATSKSTYGYLYKLAGRPISWKTKRATTIALSTLEAETNGLTEAIREHTLLKFQYVREQVKAKIVTIIYLNTKYPPMDIGSKQGFKDTITSSIVKELSKKAYTIPDNKSRNPATEAYRAAYIANSPNSTSNLNSNPNKKGKNKKKGKKKTSYNIKGQNYSAKSAEQASFMLGSYNLAIKEEEEKSDSSSNSNFKKSGFFLNVKGSSKPILHANFAFPLDLTSYNTTKSIELQRNKIVVEIPSNSIRKEDYRPIIEDAIVSEAIGPKKRYKLRNSLAKGTTLEGIGPSLRGKRPCRPKSAAVAGRAYRPYSHPPKGCQQSP
ncbi:hypothetical protein P8C59_005464 [Phyllachora maydis]|uniref:Uncharacterized protein n=1 Tax=Phyllachora maydis TaxID=1825666 RepID=A0AAD9I622_9PEZI|nr:hypothetical protein P8C59_005464 [Phyllachora maydis]